MSSSSPRGLSAERLSLYAGLAAGTGLAAAAANADIISSTTGIVAQATVNTTMNGQIGGFLQTTRDQDTFTIAGVSITVGAFNQRTNGNPRILGAALQGVGLAAPQQWSTWASKLVSGDTVGASKQFGAFSYGPYGVRIGQRRDGGSASNDGVISNDPTGFGTFSSGNFIAQSGESRGFLGIKITGATGPVSTVYGWLDFGFNADTGTTTVYAWGYDDSGAPIIAGQTGGGGAVPGLGGLAALACGAAGVRGRRHRVA
jgi:hypothetical protein